MKKYSLLLIIIFVAFTNTFSQIKNPESMTFQNVKTDTIDVDGIKFYYRKLGNIKESVPVVFLNHLGATLDNCDPRIIDGIATKHQIIAFDNRGVGATEGKTPITISDMEKDAISFIKAMGYEKVDIVGFSMGAFIAQEVLLQEPQLVRKAVMTGTGPASGIYQNEFQILN